MNVISLARIVFQDFTLSDYWGVDDTCASEYNLEKRNQCSSCKHR